MKKVIEVKGVKIGEGRPKICVPFTGQNIDEIRQEAAAVDFTKVDLVEWRADYYAGIGDMRGFVQCLESVRELTEGHPLLFTFRSHAEGGHADVSLTQYMEINKAALESKFCDLCDIEYMIGDEDAGELLWLAEKMNVVSILSNHDLVKTPRRIVMMDRLHQMQMLGGDILKLAVTPQEPADVVTLLQVTNEMSTYYARGPIITVSMGRLGEITRISGGIFGSAVTYAKGLHSSAPGQLPVDGIAAALDLMDTE